MDNYGIHDFPVFKHANFKHAIIRNNLRAFGKKRFGALLIQIKRPF